MAETPIVLIMTDQHALHAIGCYGARICRTPNIDALAAGGIRFTNAHTPCALCAPARASLFSGLYPHSHGILGNQELIRTDLDYFPRRLTELGYRLGYSGKWHAGLARRAKDMGFEGFGPRGYGNVKDGGHYERWLEEKGLQAPTPTIEFHAEGEPKRALGDTSGYTDGPTEASGTAFVADVAIDLLGKFAAADAPFFLMCSFWGPHAPYFPSADFKDLYDPADIPPWESFTDELAGKPTIHRKHRRCVFPGAAEADWPTWAQAIARYYAYASEIDHHIGRLIGKLKDLGVYDEALIVFTADHGETAGIHGGAFDKGAMAYEEVYRIPMIFKMPGGAGAGTTRPHLVSFHDLADTFCDVAGTKMSQGHGRSIAPILADADAPGREHFVAEFHRHRFPAAQRIVWWRNYKFVLNFADTGELYDLEADPAEMDNLIDEASLRGVRDEMRSRLLAHMQETDDRQGPQWQYLLERPFQP